ncbi:MAG TPA: VWA domain-containing protein [Thiotrichaceae bacterium]|nr:VWA domain-containing protein [Thiotrichaceae bacterium]
MRVINFMSTRKSKHTFNILTLLSVVSLLLSTQVGAYTVTGCFVDVNGQGISGLTVTATGDSGNTGADGCFEMTNVAAGATSLTMSASGYKSRTLSFSKVSANNKTASVGSRIYAIAATNGYKVKFDVVEYATGTHLNDVQFTINNGTVHVDSSDYVLSISEPGSYVITATKPNYDSVSISFSVSDSSPVANRSTVKLSRGGYKVTGTVLNGDRQPVSGAQVSLSTGATTTSAADGRFEIGGMMASTSFTLTVTKTGYTSATHNGSVSNRYPIRNAGNLIIREGGYQVTGRVVNADRQAVAGAQISLSSTGATTTSAADGTFEIGGMMASTSFTLTVTKKGYTSVTQNSSVNNSYPIRNMGYLSIKAGGYRAIGRILDIDKNPLAGVAISLNVGNSATTGTDGRFTVSGMMAAISFTLTASKSGYQDISRNGSVNQSYPERNLGDIYLISAEGGYRVMGCVKDAGGNEMANVVQITVGNKTGYTNNEGCYDIRLDNPGSYTLKIEVAQDIQIPNPRNPSQKLTVPKESFHSISQSIRLSETAPTVNASTKIFSPNLRLSLQASANVVVENGDLVYTVTLNNDGNAPLMSAEMWSQPELPNCWSFVSGTSGNPLQAVDHSTRPLQPYLPSINTPLNCNLSNDTGHPNSPYPRMGTNPSSVPFLVGYPFNGNPNAKTVECKELGFLGAGESTQVQVIVHASCGGSGDSGGGSGSGGSGGGSGSGPFALSFGAKATPLVVKFDAAGTPICPNGCGIDNGENGSNGSNSNNAKNSATSTVVLPKPLPKLNVLLTSQVKQVRLGEGNPLTYTLTVSNQATDQTIATGVALTLSLPTDMTTESVTLDDTQGRCQVKGRDIQCRLNDMPSGTQVPITVKFTPSKPDVGNTSVQLTSNENDTPQTVSLSYTVLRALTECEKHPSCACNPALCPVPPPPPADIAIVIDDTGSMSEEIDGLKAALKAFITQIASEKGKPMLQLVTFKDNYSHLITTDNMITLRDRYVNRLSASGGDDCPENADGALSWVLDNPASTRLKNGGRILFITDASPYDNTNIDALITKLRTRGISLDVLLSDNACIADGAKLDAINEFSKMAKETGGIFLPFFRINDPSDESAARHYENAAFSVMYSSIFPTVIAASTNEIPAGSTVEISFEAANTNFNESVEITFNESVEITFTRSSNTKRGRRDSKADIIVNQITVISATELVVNLTVPENVPPGFYDLVAKTKLGDEIETAIGRGILEIKGARENPEILSIMPTSALQDSELEVTVYSTQTHFNAGSQLSLGDPGIKVKQTRIKSNTALTALLEISETAKLGLHHVTVMTGSESATSTEEKFLVMAESKSAKIKTLSAKRGIIGGMVQLDITGKYTHFEDSVTELRFLEGITVLSLTVTSPTEANAIILIEPDAPLGYQDVIMVTGDEVAVKLNGFEVSERGPHVVEGYALDQTDQPVEKVYVAIKGQGVFTDATGYFRMTGLVSGDYSITGDKAGYHFQSQSFSVGQPPAEVATIALKAASELAVKMRPDNWRPVKQGGKITYTVTVTNKGNDTATGVILTDFLPDNTRLAAIEVIGDGSCDAGTATCQLGDLGPNAEAQVKITIHNTQSKTLINTVTVQANEYPPATVKYWQKVLPYLSLIVEGNPDPVVPEGILHYTLDVDLSPYSPEPATDVTLVTRLPQGVELKSIQTDYGNCDSSEAPTISCELVNLSIDNPDDVSHVTINLDVVLKDPGLLLLTNEAKVTANEHPAHSTRERTKIYVKGVEVDIVFVIDTTGSMQEEINSVIKALKTFIAEIDTNTSPSMALVTFKDDVTVKAFTRDLNLLREAISDIKASGGGTCPEASVEALEIAIPHTKQGGFILFATDASPYDDANVENVIEQLRRKGIRFNALITGDCSIDSSWNVMPSNEN